MTYLLVGPALTALAARIPEQQAWVDWLRDGLPLELAAHIVNVVPKALGTAAAGRSWWCWPTHPPGARGCAIALAALEAQISAATLRCSARAYAYRCMPAAGESQEASAVGALE